VTPRILLRYQPLLETVIRVSAGTGFRTVDLFNEYATVMASSRDIIVTEKLEPEKMFNFGIDLLQYFDFKSVAGSLNIDVYRTEFTNKVIPDYDTDPAKVLFANSNGKSYSNIIQAELNVNFLRNFDIKAAYKYIEIKYTQNGILVEQPFNAKHRMLTTFSYSPINKSWGANFGIQWFGKSRLPSTASNPVQYQRPLESESYTLINGQLNKNFKVFEVYAGVDNILNFKQANPIISPEEPFNQYFDTSFIWGPTKGREFYAGIRLKIN
jgi:outer membrane receptor protein involved in Fe transport